MIGWLFHDMQIELLRSVARIAGMEEAEASILFFAKLSGFHPFLTSPV
jgi:hypothetical protein